MRVTQVLYSGLGGHGSVVNSLILADKEYKWGHQLIYYGIEPLLPAYRKFCELQGIAYRYVRKKRGFIRLPGIEVIKAFRLQKPDIIILHSPTLILPAWFYCLFSRSRLFVVEHTPHATKGKGEKIASILSLLLARKVVCLSEAYQTEFQKQVPFINLKSRTVIIRNGINLSQFMSVRDRNTAEFHVGMAGRFTTQKNQGLLVDIAIEGFRSGNWGNHVHFHFAGDGDQLPLLQQRVAENKLEGQIHFHGLLDESRLTDFYRALDLYLHASFAETMCTSVMQAMASGLPVIGSDITGINDLIPEKTDCLTLLPNNGIGKWILRIMTYYQHPELVKKNGLLARKAAEQYFSAETTFAAYTKLISN